MAGKDGSLIDDVVLPPNCLGSELETASPVYGDAIREHLLIFRKGGRMQTESHLLAQQLPAVPNDDQAPLLATCQGLAQHRSNGATEQRSNGAAIISGLPLR